MYHGVYEGTAAAAQPKRILILGESHHDIESEKTTKMVMDEYLGGAYSDMFQKIAQAFGVATEKGRDEERAFLWDRVYFGNYIDVSLDGPSGEGDNTAKKLIAASKDRYNQDLADFIKARAIDVVFCFSDRVFDALPPAAALFPDVWKRSGKNNVNLWFGRAYRVESLFGRYVEVYGTPHPNYWWHTGLCPENVAEYLKPVFEDQLLGYLKPPYAQ